jgi:acyl-[acyl-carrier-protein]-phospholipid O-acyltransferase/long-chain-fatty-acid--[acyl-carrier-protein] ligase
LLARGFPPLWVPSSENFYPVDELPVLGSGKLDLRQLKVLAVEIHQCRGKRRDLSASADAR